MPLVEGPEGPRHGRRFLSRKTEEEPEPLMEEIRDAVKKLKNRKSPGCDGVPADLWKAAGESGINLLYRICVDIWTKKRMAERLDQIGIGTSTKNRK